MRYIELHLVDHCNLGCVGCSHFSNLAEPYYKSLEEYIEELMDLSKIDIQTIRLMGGEPLLHPLWLKFCQVTRMYFPHSEIVLVTNGLLLDKISADEIDELNSYHIKVCMSNYHLNLNQPSYFGIKETEVHQKGKLYNISLDLDGIQDKQKAFDNCDLHKNHWYFFKDGRIYPCCVMANIDIFLNHFGISWDYELDDVSIEVKGHSETEIEEFLNKPISLCRYCNTIARLQSKVEWCKSKGDISEWTIKEGK